MPRCARAAPQLGDDTSGIGAVTAARAGTRRTARTGESGSSIHCWNRITDADTSVTARKRLLFRELGKSESKVALRRYVRLSFATHGTKLP